MPANPTDPDKKQERASLWAIAFGAGWELVVSVLVGLGLGWWLDGRLGMEPWLTLLGAMAGISAGLYQLIRSSSQRGGPKGPGS
jgi:F0F1-type ATP synthase assembly protein I